MAIPKSLWTALLLCFVLSGTPHASDKTEKISKTYDNSDLFFTWEYDSSGESQIKVKGTVKNINGFQLESIRLAVTGLDSEKNRLNTGRHSLVDLDLGESDAFDIKIPQDGREVSFLFYYEYEFYMDGRSAVGSPTGPNLIMEWFEDKPDPNFKPQRVTSPPPYK